MLRLLSVFLLLLTLIASAILPAAAQTDGATVYIRTVDAEGFAITDACYMILNASIEGCDENRDGYIRFQDVAPGTYTVRQTTGVPGYLPVGEFPLTVAPQVPEQYADVMMAVARVPAGTTFDIAISGIESGSAALFPGGCMILHGGSIEGCDENGDGRITFDGVYAGTYLLEETVMPVGAFPLERQWIVVDHDGLITVPRTMTGANPAAGTVDLALVTRDPKSGDLLTGACYIVEGASIEGCDENGDGQVDFADIQPGVYTVRQTRAPQGHTLIEDFPITIDPLDPEQAIVVKQARVQHDANHRHVSVVLYDANTGQRIAGRTCLEIVGASLEGCDDNRDGQVDFLDVKVGTFPIEFTRLPQGYSPANPSHTVTVSRDNMFTVTVVYIGLMPVR